jgi:hypothetical protein
MVVTSRIDVKASGLESRPGGPFRSLTSICERATPAMTFTSTSADTTKHEKAPWAFRPHGKVSGGLFVVPGRTGRVRRMGRRLARGRRRCRARLRHRGAGHCLRHWGAGHGLGHGRLLDHGLRAAGHGLGRARHRHCRPRNRHGFSRAGHGLGRARHRHCRRRNGHGFSRAGHSLCTSWSAHDRPGHESTWCRPGWPRHSLSLRDRGLLRLPARGGGGLPDCIVEPVTDQALREEPQRRHGKQVGGYTRHRLPPTIRLKKMSPRAATISAVFCS